MATQRDRVQAAEILRRIAATLPEPTPTRVVCLLGQATALDPAAFSVRIGNLKIWSG
jgi:hypothetical protein